MSVRPNGVVAADCAGHGSYAAAIGGSEVSAAGARAGVVLGAESVGEVLVLASVDVAESNGGVVPPDDLAGHAPLGDLALLSEAASAEYPRDELAAVQTGRPTGLRGVLLHPAVSAARSFAGNDFPALWTDVFGSLRCEVARPALRGFFPPYGVAALGNRGASGGRVFVGQGGTSYDQYNRAED